MYHSLVPLESTEKERRKLFLGCSSLVYKATHRDDGTVVVLRRIEGTTHGELFNNSLTAHLSIGFRLTQESAFAAVETWNRLKHANIAALREAFTTRAFGDNCQYSHLAPQTLRLRALIRPYTVFHTSLDIRL